MQAQPGRLRRSAAPCALRDVGSVAVRGEPSIATSAGQRSMRRSSRWRAMATEARSAEHVTRDGFRIPDSLAQCRWQCGLLDQKESHAVLAPLPSRPPYPGRLLSGDNHLHHDCDVRGPPPSKTFQRPMADPGARAAAGLSLAVPSARQEIRHLHRGWHRRTHRILGA